MKPIRCAIYTRKSSEEGLEQDFNSLDAQREACSAYILSQTSEGWQPIPERYDDGGISGGTLQRPGLQRLLVDVAAGKIDIIVIYKIDRLTRSLLDFAKLVEAFEKSGASFVSVTQSFNTTNSMGRLTLNMLLSFAQFEREITAERIRDKLAASKAKGMWMGGVPPLGYKANGRTLAIVEPHAAAIRDIYGRYQKLRNVRLVAEQLGAEGISVPQRKSATGRKLGGGAFSRGQIYAILKSPIYAGNIAHHGKISAGNHRAIIPMQEWEEVQKLLGQHVQCGRGPRAPQRSPLAGILRSADGQPMLSTHTSKRGQRYRYYVTKALHLRDDDYDGQGMRLPAAEIEGAVASELARLFDDALALAERAQLVVEPAALMALVAQCKEVAARLRRDGLGAYSQFLHEVIVHDARLEIALSAKALADALGVARAPFASATCLVSREMRLTRTGRVARLVQDNGALTNARLADPALLQLVMRAQKWWGILRQGKIGPAELAKQEGVSLPYITRVVRVAFLAPQVIEALIAGKLKVGINATHLYKPDTISHDWNEQIQQFVAT